MAKLKPNEKMTVPVEVKFMYKYQWAPLWLTIITNILMFLLVSSWFRAGYDFNTKRYAVQKAKTKQQLDRACTAFKNDELGTLPMRCVSLTCYEKATGSAVLR